MTTTSPVDAFPQPDQRFAPQPLSPSPVRYEYVCYEDVGRTFFGSSGNTLPPRSNRSKPALPHDTLCWVLQSKGQKRRAGADKQKTQLFERARVVVEQPYTGEDPAGTTTCVHSAANHPLDRVMVRYTSGSTYRVRRSNLIPVLEPYRHANIVLVTAETCDYRRACVVHTCKSDTFLEIGCDFGITLDRVQTALTTMGEPERKTTVAGDDIKDYSSEDRTCCCLGIDKSQTSIDVAKLRFPHCEFRIEDVLTDQGMRDLRGQYESVVGTTEPPSVVAIDINGNRELPAVLQCLENVLNWPFWRKGDDHIYRGDDHDEGEHNPKPRSHMSPRLVIVKSRMLHASLKQQNQ